MKMRPAVTLDAPRLAWIEKTQPMSAHWGEKGFAGEIANAASHIWCWEENGEVQGFLALRLAADMGEILNFAVCPALCRRGIGFRLLAHALRDVRARGGRTVTLEVNVTNLPAIALYTKAGFSEWGRREKFYGGIDDALIMGIRL